MSQIEEQTLRNFETNRPKEYDLHTLLYSHPPSISVNSYGLFRECQALFQIYRTPNFLLGAYISKYWVNLKCSFLTKNITEILTYNTISFRQTGLTLVFFNLFMCPVLIAVRRLSLDVVSRGCSLVVAYELLSAAVASLAAEALALGTRASGAVVSWLQSIGSTVVSRGFSCSVARGISQIRDPNPYFLHWQLDSTEPPRKPLD